MLHSVIFYPVLVTFWFLPSIPTVLTSCINATSGTLDYNAKLSTNIVTNETFDGCSLDITALILSNNNIHYIASDAFSQFYNLEYLDISHNNITDLSDEVLAFKRKLTTFDASYNYIEKLGNNLFRDTYNIRTVNFVENNIMEIGIDVFHIDLINLVSVNISYNNLTYLEPWMYVPNVRHHDYIDLVFDFRYNQISEFTNNMNWTYNLKDPYEYEIYVQHNNITQYSDQMFLQYNPNFNDEFLMAEFLTYRLNFTLNPVICDCEVYNLVNGLHNSILFYSNVESFRFRCGSPSHLKGRDFFHEVDLTEFICNKTDKCPVGCLCQERPSMGAMVVNCSGAGLKELPDELPEERFGKIHLHLDNNDITHFTNKTYTSKIANLTITNNKLVYFDSATRASMVILEHLDLSNNDISFIPKTMQSLSFDKTFISGNPFTCHCNMTWMADWLYLSPEARDRNIICNFNGDYEKIRDVTTALLECSLGAWVIAMSIVFGVILLIAIGVVITAKKCPYETKVLLFRFFGIHPRDKYKVDTANGKDYDAYLSFDVNDIQVLQYVKTILLKKLEKEKKRSYKIFVPWRDGALGVNEANDLVANMKKSRRIVILLSPGYLTSEMRMFESDQAEMEHNETGIVHFDETEVENIDTGIYHSEQADIEHNATSVKHGRVVYILWNYDVKEMLQKEPWKSRVEGKRVLCPDDKFFWHKLRYELPLKTIS